MQKKRKGKNAKFARIDIRLLCMVIRLKNPNKDLKRFIKGRIMKKRTFTVEE